MPAYLVCSYCGTPGNGACDQCGASHRRGDSRIEPATRGYYPERDEPAPTWAEVHQVLIYIAYITAFALIGGWLAGPPTW